MNARLIPYYLSRAVLSAALGLVLSLGGLPWWAGASLGLATFLLFIWYAHSGRYLVDTSQPLTPLRRDERARNLRDRALRWAVVVGLLSFGLINLAQLWLPLPPEVGALAVLAGVAAYFGVSWAVQR
jgi:hypothetical protein